MNFEFIHRIITHFLVFRLIFDLYKARVGIASAADIESAIAPLAVLVNRYGLLMPALLCGAVEALASVLLLFTYGVDGTINRTLPLLEARSETIFLAKIPPSTRTRPGSSIVLIPNNGQKILPFFRHHSFHLHAEFPKDGAMKQVKTLLVFVSEYTHPMKIGRAWILYKHESVKISSTKSTVRLDICWDTGKTRLLTLPYVWVLILKHGLLESFS
ncbi:hypothetical protein CPC08DRAFT_817902 [Agrocybe pediades]|nr:hypothetical protein CPC08DRAFT_817902 [Agrocybe pediades]